MTTIVRRFASLLAPLSLSCLLIACSKSTSSSSSSVDAEKPVDQVKTESSTMSVDELKSHAGSYRDAILEEQKALAEKLGKDPTKLVSGGGQLGPEATRIAELRKRLDIYMDALKAKGVDVSEFTPVPKRQ